jgi:hypothetical protein
MAFIHVHVRVRAMVFNATFNSIIGGGNQSIRGKPVAIHLQTLSHNGVLGTRRHERDSNSQH